MFTLAFSLSAHAVIAAANRAEREGSLYSVVALSDYQPYPFNEEGTFRVTRKGEPERSYIVTVPGLLHSFPEGKCTCLGFAKNGVCPHVYLAVEEYQVRIAEAEHEAAEEGRAFMIECSREHAVGFTAEILADVEGAWPTCEFHGPYDAAANGAPMLSCERCEKYRFA